MKLLCCSIIVPQDTIGIWDPIPKKLNPASINMAAAKLDAEITIIEPIILGNICFDIILKFENPNAFPASMYSFSLILKIWPLTTLASYTHIVSPTAKNTVVNPFPRSSVTEIISNNVGIDQTIFINHIIKSSTHPL